MIQRQASNNRAMVQSVIGAFRPKTLTAAVVPCVAASFLAFRIQGRFTFEVFIFALLAAVFIQIGTNLVNDAMDFKKGADTSERLGPRRITQAGILSFSQVMALGTAFFVGALILGVPLVQIGGMPIVIIGLISVLMGYLYTSGPFPLAYVGLGDLFVLIFFGLVAVQGMFFLHTGVYSQEALVLGLQIGFLSVALIAINNLRDIPGDILAKKRTLAVRFGPSFAKWEIAAVIAGSFLLQFYWLSLGKFWAAVLPLLTIPLALRLVHRVFVCVDPKDLNQQLAKAAKLQLLFCLLFCCGLAVQ